MEEKKKTPNSTITRNTADFSQQTNNIYETVALLTKRADQLAEMEKKEMTDKLKAISGERDNTQDDAFESRERTEMVRKYETMPKPTLVATEEYLEHDLLFINPDNRTSREKRLEAEETKVITEKVKEEEKEKEEAAKAEKAEKMAKAKAKKDSKK